MKYASNNDAVDANYLFSSLHPEHAEEGSSQRKVEESTMNFLQDFLFCLEDDPNFNCSEIVRKLEKANTSEIIEGMKRTSKGDREEEEEEEEEEKRKRNREKEGTSTVSAKLENLLDQMPHFMAAANQAVQEHTKALKKWEKKYNLAISSDPE